MGCDKACPSSHFTLGSVAQVCAHFCRVLLSVTHFCRVLLRLKCGLTTWRRACHRGLKKSCEEKNWTHLRRKAPTALRPWVKNGKLGAGDQSWMQDTADEKEMEWKVFLLRKDPHNWEKFKIKQFRVRRQSSPGKLQRWFFVFWIFTAVWVKKFQLVRWACWLNNLNMAIFIRHYEGIPNIKSFFRIVVVDSRVSRCRWDPICMRRPTVSRGIFLLWG